MKSNTLSSAQLCVLRVEHKKFIHIYRFALVEMGVIISRPVRDVDHPVVEGTTCIFPVW